MSDKVYQLIELVGTSQQSIEDAIQNGLKKASTIHPKVDWFEVIETRGYVESSQKLYYQVTLKIRCNG